MPANISGGTGTSNNATQLVSSLDGSYETLGAEAAVNGPSGPVEAITIIPNTTHGTATPQAVELMYVLSGGALVSGPLTTADGLLQTAGGSIMPCATVVSGSGGGAFAHNLDRAPSIVLVIASDATNGSTPATGAYTDTHFSLIWSAPPGGTAYTGAWRALCIGL